MERCEYAALIGQDASKQDVCLLETAQPFLRRPFSSTIGLSWRITNGAWILFFLEQQAVRWELPESDFHAQRPLIAASPVAWTLTLPHMSFCKRSLLCHLRE